MQTLATRLLGARVCCKVGAEGIYCAALPDLGLGLALKMDDGNNARAAAMSRATRMTTVARHHRNDGANTVSCTTAPATNTPMRSTAVTLRYIFTRLHHNRTGAGSNRWCCRRQRTPNKSCVCARRTPPTGNTKNVCRA